MAEAFTGFPTQTAMKFAGDLAQPAQTGGSSVRMDDLMTSPAEIERQQQQARNDAMVRAAITMKTREAGTELQQILQTTSPTDPYTRAVRLGEWQTKWTGAGLDEMDKAAATFLASTPQMNQMISGVQRMMASPTIFVVPRGEDMQQIDTTTNGVLNSWGERYKTPISLSQALALAKDDPYVARHLVAMAPASKKFEVAQANGLFRDPRDGKVYAGDEARHRAGLYKYAEALSRQKGIPIEVSMARSEQIYQDHQRLEARIDAIVANENVPRETAMQLLQEQDSFEFRLQTTKRAFDRAQAVFTNIMNETQDAEVATIKSMAILGGVETPEGRAVDVLRIVDNAQGSEKAKELTRLELELERLQNAQRITDPSDPRFVKPLEGVDTVPEIAHNGFAQTAKVLRMTASSEEKPLDAIKAQQTASKMDAMAGILGAGPDSQNEALTKIKAEFPELYALTTSSQIDAGRAPASSFGFSGGRTPSMRMREKSPELRKAEFDRAVNRFHSDDDDMFSGYGGRLGPKDRFAVGLLAFGSRLLTELVNTKYAESIEKDLLEVLGAYGINPAAAAGNIGDAAQAVMSANARKTELEESIRVLRASGVKPLSEVLQGTINPQASAGAYSAARGLIDQGDPAGAMRLLRASGLPYDPTVLAPNIPGSSMSAIRQAPAGVNTDFATEEEARIATEGWESNIPITIGGRRAYTQ